MPDASNLLDLAKQLGGIVTLVFYASIVLWTYKDARRRIEDPILVATAVATSMLPIVGVLVYLLLRPPEYLADVRERELEIRAMERTLGRQERCPHCRSHIEGDYLSCPVCMSKLRRGCSGCDRPLDPRWAMCPYCETEVPRAAGSGRDVPGRGGRAEARRPAAGPATRRAAPAGGASPSRSTERSRRPASTTDAGKADAPAQASDKPARRAAPEAPRRATPERDRGSDSPRSPSGDTPKDDGNGIRTEPFQSGTQRFVREQKVPGTPDRPPMVHSGPPREQ